MKLFGNVLLPQDAAAADEGMINVLVNYFYQGGEFVWPVLIILIIGLAIAFERVTQLILADVNTRKFIVHAKETLYFMSDFRNSIGLFSLTQAPAIVNRHKLLALMVLLSCAACEDAAVTRVSESYSHELEVQQYDRPGNQPSYKSLPDCASGISTSWGDAGMGELLIWACKNSELGGGYESRTFEINPILAGAGDKITRSSHAEHCDTSTGSRAHGANFAMGVEDSVRVITCHDSDGNDALLLAVTYEISASIGEGSFLARWPSSRYSPDVAALFYGGSLHTVTWDSPAQVANTPVSFDHCYAFLVYGGLSERGGGPEGCGPGLQWAIGGQVAEPDGSSARLVLVAVDSSNPSMAYDWVYSSNKSVEHNHDTAIFADSVSTVDLGPCSPPVATFGYSDGSRFVVEGWAYDFVGIVEDDPDNTCVD